MRNVIAVCHCKEHLEETAGFEGPIAIHEHNETRGSRQAEMLISRVASIWVTLTSIHAVEPRRWVSHLPRRLTPGRDDWQLADRILVKRFDMSEIQDGDLEVDLWRCRLLV